MPADILTAFLQDDERRAPAPTWQLVLWPALSALILVAIEKFGYAWFHSLAELFSVVIGVSLYLIAQRTFGITRNSFLLCVATGYFWSSFIDIFHTLTYEGMSQGAHYPRDTPPLLWLCARTVQVSALLLAPRFLNDNKPPQRFFLTYGLVSVALVVMVFRGMFPVAWTPERGLSPFKIAWEWTLIFFYLIAMLQLAARGEKLNLPLRRVMLLVMSLAMLTELCFTWYIAMDGLANMVGHIVKLWGYWLMLWVVTHYMLAQPKQLLREHAHLLQDVTSRVPGMAFLLVRSPHGRYDLRYASPGVVEIFELTPEEVTARPISVLANIRPDHRALLLQTLEQSITRPTATKMEWQCELPRQGSRWHHAECSAPARQPDGTIRWIGHIHDISAQKALEQELTMHRDNLVQLVEERTKALSLAMAQTEKAARARTDFLANMSHEIRTPLNAIIGLAQIGMHNPKAGPALPYLTQINTSGRLLLALVNDILDMTKIEAGKLVLEVRPVRLAELIQHCIDLTMPGADAKGLTFEYDRGPDLPAGILTDETRLSQVLVNLLGNAVKFTETGSVKLQVRATHTATACWLQFSVFDTGIGLSDAQLARLFKPFEQGDSSISRRFGGTGLGLAITKLIVDLMGGQINVASQAGMGSSFTVRLPVSVVEAPALALLDQDSEDAGRLRGVQILAAEDDKVNQWVLKELLEMEGASCRLVDNGMEALALLQGTEPFDVFLTDVRMPVMDGYEAARQCRQLRPDLPIIGLTAHALAEERQRCLEAGMCDHVTKPINIDALVESIVRHRTPLTAIQADQTVPSTPAHSSPPDATRANTSSASEGLKIDWISVQQKLPNPDMLEKFLRLLLSVHADTPSRLRHLAQVGDADAIRELAHKLRSGTGFLAATLAEQTAQRLEESIALTRQLDPAMVERLATALSELMDQVQQRLAEN